MNRSSRNPCRRFITWGIFDVRQGQRLPPLFLHSNRALFDGRHLYRITAARPPPGGQSQRRRARLPKSMPTNWKPVAKGDRTNRRTKTLPLEWSWLQINGEMLHLVASTPHAKSFQLDGYIMQRRAQKCWSVPGILRGWTG